MNKRRKLFVEPNDIMHQIIDLMYINDAGVHDCMCMLAQNISLVRDYQKRVIANTFVYYVFHLKKNYSLEIDHSTISKLCKYATNYNMIQITQKFDILPRYAYIGLPFHVQNTIWEFLLVMNRIRSIPKVIVPFICDFVANDYLVNEPLNLAQDRYLFLSLIKNYIKGYDDRVEGYANLMFPAIMNL